jgi:hypothetical protein
MTHTSSWLSNAIRPDRDIDPAPVIGASAEADAAGDRPSGVWLGAGLPPHAPTKKNAARAVVRTRLFTSYVHLRGPRGSGAD